MQEEYEFHIRRKSFDQNGYRAEIQFEKGLQEFFSKGITNLKVIDDEEYNFFYTPKGKLCISQEIGFIHIYFEEGKFLESDCISIINLIKEKIELLLHEELESFRSN